MSDFQSSYTILDTPQIPIVEPQIHFNLGKFEQGIQDHGNKVYLDDMLECPCRDTVTGKHLPSCRNCGGSGWSLIRRRDTTALITSSNLETKFLEWSENKLGMVRVSVPYTFGLKYMNRIIVTDSLVYSNEVLHPHWDATLSKYYAYANYWVQQVDGIWWFRSKDQELVRLLEGVDYTFTKNILYFNNQFRVDFPPDSGGNEINNFSVIYKHHPQYHILDINREWITQKAIEFSLEKKEFPISAIARKSHYVLDKQNYNDTYMLDNSTEPTIGWYGTGPNPDLSLTSTQICQ